MSLTMRMKMQTPTEGIVEILKTHLNVKEVEVEKRIVEIELPKVIFKMLEERVIKAKLNGWTKETDGKEFSTAEILNHIVAAMVAAEFIDSGELLALIATVRINKLEKV